MGRTNGGRNGSSLEPVRRSHHRELRAWERVLCRSRLSTLEYLGVSEREYEVLTLLASGRTNKEIADSLFISPNTVKTHLASLYGKLEVSRRTQAIDRARRLRLIA